MIHTINLRRGWIGPSLITSITLLACVAVLTSGLPLWLRLLLVVAAFLLACHAWLSWQIHRRWHRIVTRQDGLLQLISTDGDRIIVEPMRQAFLSPIFIAFAVREADGRKIWISGFCDQFESSEYRMLLTWMRFGS